MSISADDSLQGYTEAQKALVSKESAQMQPAVQKFNAVADSPKPAPPDQQKAPPAPNNDNFSKDAQDWMTAMSAFSALAGAFSRGHATTALNSFAAGVNGFKQGNQQAFEDATKSWEGSNKAILENNKMLQDKYLEVLNDRQLTEGEQTEKLKMIAAQYHDEMMFNSDTIAQKTKLMEIREQMAGRMEMAKQRVQDHVDMMQQMEEHKQELYDAKYEQAKTDPRLIGLADTYAKTGDMNSLVKGWGTNAQENAAIIQQLAYERHPGLDLEKSKLDYARKMTESRSLGGQEIKINLASNILDSSLPSLIASAEKLGLGPSTDLNMLVNTAKRHLSEQDYANFSTQLRALTTDYAQFIGRGRQTVHSDEEAIKILSENGGINSLQGFMDAVNTEKQNVAGGISKTEKGITGGASSEPTSADLDHLKKFPASRASFDQHFGAGAADKALQGQ